MARPLTDHRFPVRCSCSRHCRSLKYTNALCCLLTIGSKLAGFAHTGAEIRTTFVTADDQGNTAVTAGQYLCIFAQASGRSKLWRQALPVWGGLRWLMGMIAGLKGYKVLKTTQSGYEGYLHDQYTLLPETRDRIMATCIAATWKYGPLPSLPCTCFPIAQMFVSYCHPVDHCCLLGLAAQCLFLSTNHMMASCSSLFAGTQAQSTMMQHMQQ